LRDRLPGYMVPSAFVALSSLPLLPFGKVNRRALPAPRWEQVAQDVGYLAPTTETQRAIAQIWQAALRVERVGVEDDFFQLGGQSLIAGEIVAEIRRRWPIDLPLSRFLEASTVAAQARLIDAPASPAGEATPLERALRLLGPA
jgi:hypothetical protein